MSTQRTPLAPQIIDEASEWFVTMRDTEISRDKRTAFVEWLRGSPMHVRAYLEIGRLWADVKDVNPNLAAEAPSEHSNIIVLRELPRPDKARHASRQLQRRVFAACVVAASVLGAVAGWLLTQPTEYSTGAAEQRVITLEDGSIVKLNARSRFSLHLSPQGREVNLLEGQAYFEVAHDPSRPFVVHSGHLAVRAVGTQFDIDHKRSGIVVSVIEGRVLVSTLGPPASKVSRDSSPPNGLTVPEPHIQDTNQGVLLLTAGEQATDVHGALTRTPQNTTNVAAATSWTQQQLIFEGEHLSDVIETLNRYSRKRIVLVDPSLADLRINAVFNTTSPEPLLRFIERIGQIEVERTDEEIRIHRKI